MSIVHIFHSGPSPNVSFVPEVPVWLRNIAVHCLVGVDLLSDQMFGGQSVVATQTSSTPSLRLQSGLSSSSHTSRRLSHLLNSSGGVALISLLALCLGTMPEGSIYILWGSHHTAARPQLITWTANRMTSMYFSSIVLRLIFFLPGFDQINILCTNCFELASPIAWAWSQL